MLLKKVAVLYSLFSFSAFATSILSMPKSELHIHLTGAYPLSYIRTITTDHEYQKIVKSLDLLKKGVPYQEAFIYFLPIEKAVNTYEKVKNGVVALAHELIADGVVYAELRMGLKDLGNGYEEYLKSVFQGILQSPKNIKINILLSLRRNTPALVIKETIDLAIKYKAQGVVGIDISGDSTLGQIADITPEVMRAKDAGLKLALHIGEASEEIDNPNKELMQAKVLETLQPDRIGHGVYLSRQSEKWLLDHPSVPVEVCPTSSVLAGMIDHHANHPGIVRFYLEHKHPIVIGTDDPLLFQTTLTKEYLKAMECEKISIKEIEQMIDWSFDFAFLTEAEKSELRKSRIATLNTP